MRRRAFALSFLFLAAAACGPTSGGGGDDGDGPDASGGDDDPDARPWTPPGDGGVMERCEKIDILFVVDNSGSMGEEQTNLTMNFPAFIAVIEESGLDYRVAVTSTGVDYEYTIQTPIGPLPGSVSGGDNGVMLQSCGMTRRWIEKTDNDPAGTFACLAALGTGGPGDEMPLAAMRMAFDDRMLDSTNAGFRRNDALLAIVMLTDENDCSYEAPVNLQFTESLCDAQMEPVSNYVGFLDTYTGDRGRWATAVIAGPGPAECTSEFGGADYCQRLDEFVQMTGTNAVFSSICEGDLTVGLADALELFSAACDEFPPID
jgi:hypothetical protein